MAYSKASMQQAISNYQSGLNPSKQAAASATLRYRPARRTLLAQARES